MPEAFRSAVFWVVMVLFASHLGLALAAAGIPCITSVVGLRKAKRLKIFIDKFGQQASTFALLGGFWVFVVFGAVLTATKFLAPGAAPYFLGIPLPLAAFVVPILAGAATFLAYRGLWQRLKTNKPLHAAIGLSASLLLWFVFYAGLAAARLVALEQPPAVGPGFLLPPGGALFWRLLLEGLAFSLALAGTFTGAWLVWRRNKDDFGRDYYNFTMRLTARVGFASHLIALVLMGWIVVGLMPFVGELNTRQMLATGLYGTGVLLSIICLGWVMPQENTLRYKMLLVVAFAASIMALTGLCAGLTAVFTPGLLATLP
jgi:hypothetical protein